MASQGELLGVMLDLIVRDATGGRRSMDARDARAILREARVYWARRRTYRRRCLRLSHAAFFDSYVRAIGRARVGDTVRVEVRRPAGPWRTDVVVTGYDRPIVRVEEVPGATERRRALRASWVAGAP